MIPMSRINFLSVCFSSSNTRGLANFSSVLFIFCLVSTLYLYDHRNRVRGLPKGFYVMNDHMDLNIIVLFMYKIAMHSDHLLNI